MRLFIPNLKTNLILTQDWTFRLYNEYRNTKGFRKSVGVSWPSYQEWCEAEGLTPEGTTDERPYKHWIHRDRYQEEAGGTRCYKAVTLPKGTILRVSRIYIRNGAQAFDSITFSIKKRKGHKVSGRFWAKLADVNLMEADIWLGEDNATISPAERERRLDELFEV
jgi:hypothetical protein